MRDYDPKKVIVVVAGVPMKGFGSGTKVSISKEADDWNLHMGTDGEGTRGRVNDESGTITITLAASSPSNGILTTMREADKIAGAGVKPVMVKDMLGTTLVLAAQAWILKPPDIEFGTEVGEYEWVFKTHNLKIFAGGSHDSGSLIPGL